MRSKRDCLKILIPPLLDKEKNDYFFFIYRIFLKNRWSLKFLFNDQNIVIVDPTWVKNKFFSLHFEFENLA